LRSGVKARREFGERNAGAIADSDVGSGRVIAASFQMT
jgi:hypothetical protein